MKIKSFIFLNFTFSHHTHRLKRVLFAWCFFLFSWNIFFSSLVWWQWRQFWTPFVLMKKTSLSYFFLLKKKILNFTYYLNVLLWVCQLSSTPENCIKNLDKFYLSHFSLLLFLIVIFSCLFFLYFLFHLIRFFVS